MVPTSGYSCSKTIEAHALALAEVDVVVVLAVPALLALVAAAVVMVVLEELPCLFLLLLLWLLFFAMVVVIACPSGWLYLVPVVVDKFIERGTVSTVPGTTVRLYYQLFLVSL